MKVISGIFESSWVRLLSATGLIMGTAIGAGMLGLPVDTARCGYVPSIFIYFACWLIMTASGLLFLDICSKTPGKEVNLISIVQNTLGKKFLPLLWILYLTLLYSLILVYSRGMTTFIQEFLGISSTASYGVLMGLLLPCLYAGPSFIGKTNSILAMGLMVSYLMLMLLGFGLHRVEGSLLASSNWSMVPYCLPIIITSFGFHIIIPTVYQYLERSYQKTQLAIILGTSIAFVCYLLWQTLVMGIIPKSVLLETLQNDLTVISPLSKVLKNSFIVHFGRLFGFFALSTSILGVSLSLFDFLADGLKLAKHKLNKAMLAGMVFIPPFIFSVLELKIFYVALRYGAGLTVTILLILLPALVSLKNKCIDKENLIGGYRRVVLYTLSIFSVLEICTEVAHLIF